MRSLKRNSLLLTGFFLYLVLFCLALWYYRQRTMYSDSAFCIFRFIITRNFVITDRYISFFTQSLPLAAVYLHLPLKAVLISYSSAYVIVCFAAFTLSMLVFKQPGFGLAMLLFPVFIVRDTFFWYQSELFPGIAMCIVLFAFLAWLNKGRLKQPVNVLLLIIITGFVVFAHPLMPFIFGILAVYFLLSGNVIDRKVLITGIVAFTLIILVKRFALPVTSYDTQAMDRAKNIVRLFPNYLNLPSNLGFAKACVNYFYAVPFAFIAVTWAIINRKNWVLLLFFIFSTLGYLLFINISFKEFSSINPYLENIYLTFSIILIVPLVFEVLLPVAGKKWFLPLLVIFFTLRITGIINASGAYTKRQAINKQILERTAQLPHRKVVMDAAKAGINLTGLDWALPYELLELSSLQSPDSARCVIAEPGYALNYFNYDRNKDFIGVFESIPFNEIDTNYFNLKDTSRYVLVDHI